jgi:glucan 1,3-beta-glucosidase
MDIQNGTRSFVDDIVRASQHLQDTRGLSYQYAVGETNWPSGGADYGNAVPSIKNMETYFQKAICGVLRWNVDIFVHSPFDEPTKAAEGGDNVEQHWGLMTSDRKPKFNLRCNQ